MSPNNNRSPSTNSVKYLMEVTEIPNISQNQAGYGLGPYLAPSVTMNTAADQNHFSPLVSPFADIYSPNIVFEYSPDQITSNVKPILHQTSDDDLDSERTYTDEISAHTWSQDVDSTKDNGKTEDNFTIEEHYYQQKVGQNSKTTLNSSTFAKRFGSLTLNSPENLRSLGKVLDKKVDTSDLSEHFKGYHHATWYVSNAKQAASYFVTCFGFEIIAYKGLETRSNAIAAHVVKNGDVVLEFVSPLVSTSKARYEDRKILEDIHNFIEKHGDAVKDISFNVTDVDSIYENATKEHARGIQEPTTLTDDYGSVRIAVIEVFEDVRHTLIDCKSYKGAFLPGYEPKHTQDRAKADKHPVKFKKIDHCVQNEDWDNLDAACDIYSNIFGFHRFWSVDERQVSTEYSALRSVVMASKNEEVKMPINEPAFGACKSQIEEFIQFHDGSGVQHIALSTSNIIQTVSNLRSRGAEFISVPSTYYEKLSTRLRAVGLKLDEKLSELKRLGILVDFDEKGYLLQLFTKPLSDRPTFFLEIIQRNNHNGFGAGNFRALFETIESEQRLRGTLEY